MKNKKAQTTVFMLLGIVILIALILLYFIRSEQIKSYLGIEEKIDPTLQPLKTEVESCMEDIADEGLKLLGLQGGRIYSRSGYLQVGNGKLFYLGQHSQSMVPTNDMVEKDLSNFMVTNLKECAKNFTSSQYPIREDAGPKAKAEIKDKQVIFQVIWPLTLVRKGDYKLTNFKYETPKENTQTKSMIRLGKLLDIAKDIVGNTCIARKAIDSIIDEEPSVSITYTHYKGDILYFLEDNNYMFRFAISRCLAKSP